MCPVSRATAEELAREVAAAYAEAERLMLERIARNLAKGIDAPDWASKKLAQMAAYRLQMQTLIADLEIQAKTGVETALTQAYERGGLAALNDLGKSGVIEPVAGRAVEKLTLDLIGALEATSPRVLRVAMDAYRDAVARGAEQVLLGTSTRVQGAQMVLDNLAAKGITGFIDSAGRSWSLESYAEMAVRAGIMKASVLGHTDTLQGNGIDLVIVSADGSPCELCQPWEGQVLSISGDHPDYPSVADCEAAGWGHPNCRHTMSAYQEGITRDYPEKSDEDLADEAERYADNQKLRYIERKIRESKRMEAVAMTPEAKANAKARTKAYQAKAREHVSTTEATRQYAREQIGKAH